MVAAARTILGASPGAAWREARKLSLLDLGGEPGGRASSLDHHHHQGNLGHGGETDELGLERQPRPRGDGARGLSRIACADGEPHRGDLVLGLMQTASQVVIDTAQIVGRRGRRGDGVHGHHVHSRSHDAQAHGLVSVHHHLGNVLVPGGHGEPEIEVVLGVGVPGPDELMVLLDDLGLLPGEGHPDLLQGLVHVATVDVAEHAENEHVLAHPGLGYDLGYLPFQGQLVNRETLGPELLEGGAVLGLDFLRGIFSPLALQENHRPGLKAPCSMRP